MSEHYLGVPFDIHGGGLDLIFPHHENEIAQSRCAHGMDADGALLAAQRLRHMRGAKMAKSEGNFVTPGGRAGARAGRGDPDVDAGHALPQSRKLRS